MLRHFGHVTSYGGLAWTWPGNRTNRALHILGSILFAGAFIVSGPAIAKEDPAPSKVEREAPQTLQSSGHYVNRSGQVIHSPSATSDGKAPKGASAKCRDNTYSFSANRSGTCSHHGGVAAWL